MAGAQKKTLFGGRAGKKGKLKGESLEQLSALSEDEVTDRQRAEPEKGKKLQSENQTNRGAIR
ncbi:MAG: hypothetical protein ACREQ2_16840 [Candidatus Binatia bacterium]